MNAIVVSVNRSEKKGVAKKPAAEIELRPDWGVVGDAHAGQGRRQVSLLAAETVARWKESVAATGRPVPEAGPGAFAENVTTRGLDLPRLPLGTVLRIGADVRVSVSEIGKEDHPDSFLNKTMGASLIPKEGIFVRVLKGGIVRPGDEIMIDANRDSDDQ